MADQVSLALKAIDGITPSLVNISKNLDKLTKDSARMGKDMDNAFKKMDAGAKKSANSMGGFGLALKAATAYMSVDMIKNFGLSAIESAAKWEKLGLAINTMEGSAARGVIVMDKLYEAAKAPGIGLEQLQSGFLKFKGLGYEAEQSIPIFQNLGNAIASTGGSAQEFESVTRQMAQMISKGSVLQEDVSIMSESMPIIATLMEKAFGTANVENIRSMGINGRMFVQAISDAAATLPPASQSMGNSIDNMATAWDRLKASFVDTSAMKSLLDAATTTFEGLKTLIEDYAKTKAKYPDLFSFSSPVGVFINGLKGVKNEVSDLLDPQKQLTSALEAQARAQDFLNASTARAGSVERKSHEARLKVANQDVTRIRDRIAQSQGFGSYSQQMIAGGPADPLAKYASGITQSFTSKTIGSTSLPWIDEKANGWGGGATEKKKAKKKTGKTEAQKAEEKRIDEMLESVDSWGAWWEGQYQIVGELSAKKAEEDLALDNAALEEKKKAFNLLMKERAIRSKEVEDKITEDYQNAIAVREQLSLNFANAFADSMSAAYFRAKQDGDNFFSSFLESFGLMLEQMAVQMAAKAFIFSAFSALSGGSSTVLGGAASFIFGARASGGYVANGGAYTVGENRRESFVPDRPGRIAPTSASSVTINVQAAPGMDTKQLAREIVRAQEDATRRRLRANV
jgi:tape measure domain-containing protein